MKLSLTIIIALCHIAVVYAWDSEQLEVFDVVEEVRENFYNLLNISQDATEREIKSAFRGLSLKLHPDKNLGVDTSVQFRNLVSVYEVLRSPTKRKYYNEVLVNGLPNWKSAMYYYRYVRKMGMTEACVILFIIFSIGQYLMHWGAYFEKLYTLEQNKKRKYNRKDKNEAPIEVPKPSVRDTLPVQIPKLIWFTIISIPQTLISMKSFIAHCLEEAKKKPPPVVEEVDEIPKPKAVRKRKAFVLPEGPNFVQPSNNGSQTDTSTSSQPIMSGGLWTDDDLSELIKLVKKHPGGTPKRWEVIAESLGRSVPEVTYMANKMKENGYRLPSEVVEEIIQPKVKQKTKKEIDVSDDVKKWSQVQQKALEEALAKYSKGCSDRWDRIAEAVPNKTKEECMMRFRYVAECLRKQKESKENQVESQSDISEKNE